MSDRCIKGNKAKLHALCVVLFKSISTSEAQKFRCRSESWRTSCQKGHPSLSNDAQTGLLTRQFSKSLPPLFIGLFA